MQFVTLYAGEVVAVTTPTGSLSIIALSNGEVAVSALYEGDGSTRRATLVSFPGRNRAARLGGVEAVVFEPNPNT